MQAEKSELQKIIQTIWSSELYKIILSNPTGEGTYRKIVLNQGRKRAGRRSSIQRNRYFMKIFRKERYRIT